MKNKDENNRNTDREAELDRILEAKFQGMAQDEEIPESLKKEVFNTLDTVEFLAEVVDLFAVKFPLANLKFLGESEDNKDAEPDDENK